MSHEWRTTGARPTPVVRPIVNSPLETTLWCSFCYWYPSSSNYQCRIFTYTSVHPTDQACRRPHQRCAVPVHLHSSWLPECRWTAGSGQWTTLYRLTTNSPQRSPTASYSKPSMVNSVHCTMAFHLYLAGSERSTTVSYSKPSMVNSVHCTMTFHLYLAGSERSTTASYSKPSMVNSVHCTMAFYQFTFGFSSSTCSRKKPLRRIKWHKIFMGWKSFLATVSEH